MPIVKRARGAILRLVRRRPTAVAIGAALVVPAGWIQLLADRPWWADGLSLVLGATGAALIWTGLTGARPDWTDPGEPS